MRLSKVFSTLFVLVLIALLVSVRLFENELFNDPLNDYFRSNFKLYPIPEIAIGEIIASTTLRYVINTLVSLSILWFLYKNATFIKASLWVYGFGYVLLIIPFVLLLDADTDFTKMALFYIRRFLIHPIVLLILVAGLYFLQHKQRAD